MRRCTPFGSVYALPRPLSARFALARAIAMSRAAGWVLAVVLGTTVCAQTTVRVSVGPGGAQGNGDSSGAAISADGRFAAFHSAASNLVTGDTNALLDVFVRDRQTGATERVSLDSVGGQGNNNSGIASISADGRYVAFLSHASNLVSGDLNGSEDVFVRDRQLGVTERVSVDSSGMEGNGDCIIAVISADGRFVAFESLATNLVAADTNGQADIFVRDRQLGLTERVSVDSSSAQANNYSHSPSISADGRFVTFQAGASNLVGGDTNGADDVFVRDRQLGLTERVSVDSSGTQANNWSYPPSISADGRHVAFFSNASNLVAGDTNATTDIFVRDRQLGTTTRVSVDSSGAQANSSSISPSISGDGRYVAFSSTASNLVSGDTNGVTDIFVRDLQLGTTDRASVDSAGVQGNGQCQFGSISSNGRYVAFRSQASNLVSGDTNAVADVFVRDRNASGFTSLCDPGLAGVIACPCSNPPSASGRGCNNSSSTGGAILSASGLAYLATDSLVFTTSGEKPTATSILLQGNALIAAGAVYGQGVRCAGGSLKRLYTKSAVGGSITAPDFGAGDPTVSARSAALGSTILPGQSRWYLVYYRDPIVLGGCPASSSYNATQTGEVAWSL